jgi:ribonuclease P protein component
MKKEFRVKKDDEIQKIFQKGQSFANRQFVVYALDKPDQTHFRIGLSVSKKIGNAVMRNRIKRLIRQVIFEMKDRLPNDKDFMIIARKPTAEMDYHEIKPSLEHVLKVGKILKPTKRF